MSVINSRRAAVLLYSILFFMAVSCCSGGKTDGTSPVSGEQPVYTVYLMNRGIHTGLIIPVNELSIKNVAALKYFEKAEYIDFGWGDEEVYQARVETFCMDLRAVIIPSSSVMRVEVFPGEPENLAAWSGYTVAFRLTGAEFLKLCSYIDSGFTRDGNGQLIRTSVKSGGDVVYFKSVHTYCGLNTCNTWDADALKSSGLDVSSFMVITEGGLYDEVKKAGIVIKARE